MCILEERSYKEYAYCTQIFEKIIIENDHLLPILGGFRGQS